jgi:P27 family predicted phage terminase small subunit
MSKAKSADIHHLHGNPSNLSNLENRDVRPDPIVPNPPNWLSKRGRDVWKFLALEKSALLTKRDREAFAFLCEEAVVAQIALLRLRGSSNNYDDLLQSDPAHAGRLRRHPAWIIYTQAKKAFLDSAKEFGLTPSSRIGLLVGGPSLPAGRANDPDDQDEELFA